MFSAFDSPLGMSLAVTASTTWKRASWPLWDWRVAFTAKDVSTQFHTYLNMKVTSSRREFVILRQFEGIKHRHRSIVLEEPSTVTHQICATDHRKQTTETLLLRSLTACQGIPPQGLTAMFQTQLVVTEIISQAEVTRSGHTAANPIHSLVFYVSCSTSPGTRSRMTIPT